METILQRGGEESERSNKERLGLGLYIVREITRAHRGEVEAQSDARETVFTVRPPRRAEANTRRGDDW